jgi:3-oxoacyl-[acyl-carrier-protein] synthase II
MNISDIQPHRRALYIASGDFTNVGYDFMYPAVKDGSDGKWQKMDYEKMNRSTLDKVNPFFLLQSIYNNLFSFLSALFEFMGPNTSIASLSPGGGQALEMAFRSIKQGKADIAMAVGCCNWITEIPIFELEGLGIISKCKNGAESYKPFDKHRNGFIPAEGGASVFMESYDMAKDRGAKILGKVLGVGNCIEFSGREGLIIPPKVSKRSIKLALEEAGIDIFDLAFINPHGSGTRKGDRSELNSLIDLLGERRSDIPICGMKPYTGHMGAASDIAEVIFGIMAVTNGTIPATLNFNETEKEFSGLMISNSLQECGKGPFLSVSYGIGGQSSSVALSVD